MRSRRINFWLSILVSSFSLSTIASAKAADAANLDQSQPDALKEFWADVDGSNVKTLGDVWDHSCHFGELHDARLIDAIMRDLAQDKSSVANAPKGRLVREDRYDGAVIVLIFSKEGPQVLEKLGYWQKGGNNFQSLAAEEWLRKYKDYRLIRKGDKYSLKYRVWPGALVTAKESGQSIEEYMRMWGRSLPTPDLFKFDQVNACLMSLQFAPPAKGATVQVGEYLAGKESVSVSAAETKAITDMLLNPNDVNAGSMCIFDPGLLIKLQSGHSETDIEVCLHCFDIAVLRDGKEQCGGTLSISPELAMKFVKIALRLNPADPFLKQVESDLN